MLQLCSHCLGVRILHKEFGAELGKLGELDGTAAVLVDLFDQVGQLLRCGAETHGSAEREAVKGGEEEPT